MNGRVNVWVGGRTYYGLSAICDAVYDMAERW